MSLRDNRQFQTAVTEFRTVRNSIRDSLPHFPGVPYLYIAPFFVLFGVFMAFPALYTLYLSFFEYVGPGRGFILEFVLIPDTVSVVIPRISNLEYLGLGNYQRLYNDQLFWKSLHNTLYIAALQMPLMLLTSLGVALALDASFTKYSNIIRTAIALPISANFVAYSSIFLLMFAEDVGFINFVLQVLPVVGPVAWQTDPFWAKVSISLALDWRWMGYNMLFFFAGLQNIPDRLYEAAEIDGATRWEKFRYITLPQLRPITLFVIVLSTIGALKLFAEPQVITSGGPTNSTMTVVLYIYQLAFQRGAQFGYAAAVSFVLVVLIATLSIVQLRLGGDD